MFKRTSIVKNLISYKLHNNPVKEEIRIKGWNEIKLAKSKTDI